MKKKLLTEKEFAEIVRRLGPSATQEEVYAAADNAEAAKREASRGFLSHAAEQALTPLWTGPSRAASAAANAIDQRSLDETPLEASLKGLAAGVTQATGDVVSSMTSPLDIAMTLLGVGASKTAAKGLLGASKALRAGETAANAALEGTGVAQAAKGLSEEDLGQVGAGSLMALLGASGARTSNTMRRTLPVGGAVRGSVARAGAEATLPTPASPLSEISAASSALSVADRELADKAINILGNPNFRALLGHPEARKILEDAQRLPKEAIQDLILRQDETTRYFVAKNMGLPAKPPKLQPAPSPLSGRRIRKAMAAATQKEQAYREQLRGLLPEEAELRDKFLKIIQSRLEKGIIQNEADITTTFDELLKNARLSKRRSITGKPVPRETIPPDDLLTLEHRFEGGEHTELDPEFYGKRMNSSWRGEELRQKQNYPNDWVDRIYGTVEGGEVEPNILIRPHLYKSTHRASRIYDGTKDPAGLRAVAKELATSRSGPGDRLLARSIF